MSCKLRNYLVIFFLLIVSYSTAQGQKAFMLVYKSKDVIFERNVSEIDSVKFYRTSAVGLSAKETMFVYRNGRIYFQKYTSAIDSVTFSKTSQISPLSIIGTLAPVIIQGCSFNSAPMPVTTIAGLEQLEGSVTIIGEDSWKANLKVSSEDFLNESCPLTINRSYSVKDDSSNIAYVIQQIIFQDYIPPVVSGKLTAINITGCSVASAPAPVTTVAALEKLPGAVTIFDNCTSKGNLTVVSVDVLPGGCPVTINRTYTITDACNNSTSISQQIIIEDNIPPIIQWKLSPITVPGCSVNDVPKPVTTIAALEQMARWLTVSEVCTRIEDMTVTSEDTVMSICPMIIDRYYTIHLSCNSSTFTVQHITIEPDVKSVGNAVYIPCGSFMMGSPATEVKSQADAMKNDETQHKVTLSAFYMSKYEVSNAEYAAFLNAKKIGSDGKYSEATFPGKVLIDFNQSGFEPWGIHYSGGRWIPYTGFENHPVVFVTWYGAMEYAKYAGGRLPTEAEWEYACRAGTTTPFSTGNCLTNLQANYDWKFPYEGCTNSTDGSWHTVAVNSYSPNAWGLYNMHGNVSEWCSDWYGPYSSKDQINPTGNPTGSTRVYRGGGNSNIAHRLRSAYRGDFFSPGYASFTNGFRVAYSCGTIN